MKVFTFFYNRFTDATTSIALKECGIPHYVMMHTQQHTIATVAYRFDVGPQSIVISGDLTYSESLVELARGADVLVIDSGVLPGGETPGRGGRGGGAGRAAGAGGAAGRANNQGAARGAGRGGRAGAGAATTEGGAQAQRAHPSLAEVASMASQAGVPCLVLTHLNQTTVDEAATREIFQPLYTGKVVVAADLMEVSAACVVSKKG